MIKQKILLASLASVVLFASSCSTVRLSDGGEKVRVLAPDEVTSCREMGKSSASVTATALGVPRPPETIANELTNIGRNSASNMGGDTIVPLTVISEGQQTFIVYKCVNPDG